MVAGSPPCTLTASSLLHQGAVQAGGLVGDAAAEHVQVAGAAEQAVQHGEGEEIGVAALRGVVGHLDVGGLAGAFHGQAALAGLGRLGADQAAPPGGAAGSARRRGMGSNSSRMRFSIASVSKSPATASTALLGR